MWEYLTFKEGILFTVKKCFFSTLYQFSKYIYKSLLFAYVWGLYSENAMVKKIRRKKHRIKCYKFMLFAKISSVFLNGFFQCIITVPILSDRRETYRPVKSVIGQSSLNLILFVIHFNGCLNFFLIFLIYHIYWLICYLTSTEKVINKNC